MRFILWVMLCMLCTARASGQCSGCTSTISPDATTRTVGTGVVLCITGSGTHTGQITLENGGVICIGGAVTFTGNFTTNNVNSSSRIEIQSGATFNPANFNMNGSTNGLTINNRGTWRRAWDPPSGATTTFNNSGTYGLNASNRINLTMQGSNNVFNNTGSMFINNFNMNNPSNFSSTAGSISVANNMSINGTLSLSGTTSMSVAGSFTVNGSGTLNMSGSGVSLSTTGQFQNNNNATFSGTVNIGGDLTNNGGGTMNFNNVVAQVNGTVTNNGTMSVPGTATCGGIRSTGNARQNGGGTTNANVDICSSPTPSGTNLYNSQAGTVNSAATRCTCSPPVLLPLVLTAFTATLSEQSVLLRWQLAGHADADEHYRLVVERAIGESGTFRPLVAYTQQDDAVLPRSFTDEVPAVGHLYYRLRLQTQAYERFSPVVSVQVQPPAELLQIHPNLARPRQDIFITGGDVSAWEMLDVHGSVIGQGTRTESLQAPDQAGVYLLRLTNGQGRLRVFKIVVE